jgi:NAD+ synthase (glutamine-hydrolysing)
LLRQTKILLPTYDVFDEARNFVPGERSLSGGRSGKTSRSPSAKTPGTTNMFWTHQLYPRDPVDELMQQGGSMLVSINASPFIWANGSCGTRCSAPWRCATTFPMVVVNQVGGNDQVVFDGSSFAMDAAGNVIARPLRSARIWCCRHWPHARAIATRDLPDECEAVYEALVLGTRDYIRKCGFSQVLIGLSGGIDSSLTAVIAVDAVGRENVRGVAMPGPFSSDHSVRDARRWPSGWAFASTLFRSRPPTTKCCRTLGRFSKAASRTWTEENIQARLRGLTLMSLSNKFGAMVLTTGNKSESRWATARSTAICAAGWR